MARPPKDTSKSRVSDPTPRPRASRGKSGKPPAPPREGAAGTPETRRSAQGFAEASAPFLPAPEGARPLASDLSPHRTGGSDGSDPVSRPADAARSTLPALRQ